MDSLWISSFLILFPLLIPAATSQDSRFLQHICTQNSSKFNQDDPFAKNLKSLLDGLLIEAPSNEGFDVLSFGSAYGIALCRGDVSEDSCNYCLYDARCKILQRCNRKSALVWYDYCFLKYSNYNFFGEMDSKNGILMHSGENATDPEFKKKVQDMLSDLTTEAIQSSKFFAQGDVSNGNETIYGLAQCSKDLSQDSCTTCLGQAVEELPLFDQEYIPVGGRALTGSCMVRYDKYYFFENDPDETKVVKMAG